MRHIPSLVRLFVLVWEATCERMQGVQMLSLRGSVCVRSIFFPLKIYLFSYLCVHDCLYIWVCEHDCGTHRGQKGASDTLELEFTGVVRHPLCGSDELRPSGCVMLYS